MYSSHKFDAICYPAWGLDWDWEFLFGFSWIRCVSLSRIILSLRDVVLVCVCLLCAHLSLLSSAQVEMSAALASAPCTTRHTTLQIRTKRIQFIIGNGIPRLRMKGHPTYVLDKSSVACFPFAFPCIIPNLSSRTTLLPCTR